MQARKLLFFILIAFFVALAIGNGSKTLPYHEQLLRLQAEQTLGPIDPFILEEPLDIQALLMDYSGPPEWTPTTQDQELVLKAWLALSKYPEPSREVLRLYGSRPEFQEILREYGEAVIPVIQYFLVNEVLTVKVIDGVETATARVQQGVENTWNRLRGNATPGEVVAPLQGQSVLGPELRGWYAVNFIQNEGHQFLGQFSVDASQTAHWNQTNRIAGGLVSFLTSGVSGLERKYALEEDIQSRDVFFAAIDVIPFVVALKLMRAGKVVINSGKELSLMGKTKMFAPRLIPKNPIFLKLGKYGALAATGYVILTHPGLLNSVFARVADFLGLDPLAVQFLGWFVLLALALYPFAWLLKILSGAILLCFSWLEPAPKKKQV